MLLTLSLSLSLCDYEVFRRISFDFPFNIQKIKIYVEWKRKKIFNLFKPVNIMNL